MWIRQAPNGKFQFGETYKDPLTGKWRSVTVTDEKNTTHTRKQAKIKLEAKIKVKLKDQTSGVKKGVTLGQVIEEWLPYYHQRVKEKTYYTALDAVKLLKKEIDPDTLLSNLTKDVLTDVFEGLMFKRKMKYASMTMYRGQMRNILEYAVRKKYVAQNNARNLKLACPQFARSRPIVDKFLTDEELKIVISGCYARGERYGHFCEFLYLTGMRFGEAAALQWKNIIEIDGQKFAHIDGTIFRPKGGEAVKQSSPKTDSSIRDVALSKRACSIIAKEKAQHPDSQWIFVGASGGPMVLSTTNQNLWAVAEENGITKQISTHIFRHTHISKLAELGVPLYLIQRRVGHKNGATTQQIYLHVTKKAEQKMIDKINFL